MVYGKVSKNVVVVLIGCTLTYGLQLTSVYYAVFIKIKFYMLFSLHVHVIVPWRSAFTERILEGRVNSNVLHYHKFNISILISTFYLGEGIGKKSTLNDNYMPVKMLAVMADPL